MDNIIDKIGKPIKIQGEEIYNGRERYNYKKRERF